jgi:TonB family protein
MIPAHMSYYRIVAAVVGTVLFTPVLAERYDVGIWNSGATAKPIEQTEPAFPTELAESGQEGWVRMHFVINADGQAIDPIIIDSSGGPAFEAAARAAAADWRFAPPESGSEDAHNLVNIRSEVRGSRDSATKSFRRDHERIVLDLVHEQNEDARQKMDELYASGGFNTYESTMLWLRVLSASFGGEYPQDFARREPARPAREDLRARGPFRPLLRGAADLRVA